MKQTEIKFRVWDGEKMWYSDPISEGGDDVTFHFFSGGNWDAFDECRANWICPGKDCRLIQFSGFRDKNKKEIYTGDVVTVDNSESEEKGEHDVTTVCKRDNGCFFLEDQSGGQWMRQLFHQPDRLTIIGNIYQDSHLLSQPSSSPTQIEP